MEKQSLLLPEDVYRELTGSQPSTEQLNRWRRLQRALDINRGDAIWAIIIAFDFYDDCFSKSALKVVFWARLIAALFILQIFLTTMLLRIMYLR